MSDTEPPVHDNPDPFQAIFEQASVGLAQVGLDGRLLRANRRYAELAGAPPDELIGATVGRLPDARLVAGEVPELTFEERFARGDGAPVPVELAVSVVRDAAGAPRHFLAVAQDLRPRLEAQRALRESEAMFREMADAIPQLAWMADPRGEIFWYNQRWLDYTGLPLAVTLGRGWTAVHDPAHLARVVERFDQALARGETWEDMFPLRRHDGVWRWFLSRAVPCRDDEGRLSFWFGTNTDVTDVLRADEARARLVAIVESTDDAIMAKDVDGIITDWNPGAERLFGYTAAEAVGRPMTMIIPLDRLHEERHVLATVKAGGRIDHLETLRQCKNGCLIPVSISVSPIRDLTGRVIRLAQIARDQSKLQRAEESLRLAVAATGLGIWDYDLLSGRLSWSDRCKEIYGFAPDEDVRSEDFLALVEPEDVPRVREAFARADDPAGDGILDVEYRIRLRGGEVRWVAERGRVHFMGEGAARRAIRRVGTALDVTREKEAAEALRRAKVAAETASQTKSQFLSNVSHELRTPLNAILGFAELLKDPSLLGDEHDSYVETILRNGRNLGRLLDDILDLSKVEAGRLVIERLPVHVLGLIEDVAAMFQPQAAAKGVDLRVECGGGHPEAVLTDPTRLRQILVNIVGNAVKFSQRGSIVVRCNGYAEGVRLEVQDQGPGMTPEQQSRLFQPFSQADASVTRRYGGTGLGLSLSRRLARALGGDVTLGDCAPGEGCTFVITIKAETAEAAPRQMPAREEAPPPPEDVLAGARILLAEDSPDSRHFIKTVLERKGLAVDTAANGVEALEKASRSEYDVVLMDIQMPELDGLEATRRLRRQGYRGPIVALTAHAMLEERERTRKAGCNEHLTKPVSPKTLLFTIGHYVGGDGLH